MNNKSKVTKTLKGWQLDESILTDEDKAVLEAVGFPKSLKSGLVLIRRTQKRNVGKMGWISKENPTIADVKYLTTSFAVANNQVASMIPHAKTTQGLDRSPMEIKADIEKIQDMQTSKSFGQVYLDAENIDEELDEILSLFSSPKPTKGMKAFSDTLQAEDIESVEVKAPKVKGLSNKDKGIAKRMYQEESKSLEEITAELGEEKNSKILTYLKTLN